MSGNRRSPRAAALVLALMALTGAQGPLVAAQRFLRGDSNVDGVVNISDALHIVGLLFLGKPPQVSCDDAVDANDDGGQDVSDAVFVLLFLFRGGQQLPAPFPGCGEDPTADVLGCASFDPCLATPPAPPVLEPPASPTRAASIELGGTAAPGLLVRITGGSDPVPILVRCGPDGAFTATVELTTNRRNRLFAVVKNAEKLVSAPAAESGQALGKKGDPDAVYWAEAAGSTAHSDDGFKLTCSSETITIGPAKGTALISFLRSGVGGDDFKLKAAVKCGARTLKEKESGVLVVWRCIHFGNIFEMPGLTHVSRNGTKDIIQPYFDAAFVDFDVDPVLPVPDELSVKYLGLYRDAIFPQEDWNQIQMKQASPWTIAYGPFQGESVTTEIPTLDELTDADYSGDDQMLILAKLTAMAEISKKAQSWVERIDFMRELATVGWIAAAKFPEPALVGVHHYHPKYNQGAGESITEEWPFWVTVTTLFGRGRPRQGRRRGPRRGERRIQQLGFDPPEPGDRDVCRPRAVCHVDPVRLHRPGRHRWGRRRGSRGGQLR